MLKKYLILILLPALCLTSFVIASDLSGKWTGQLTAADGTAYPLLYNLTLQGDSITGTSQSTYGEFPIKAGKLDSAGFSFKVSINGMDIQHTGKFYGDSLGMDINLNGSSVHCTLNRAN